jgi:GT2 family glycosyltransferase
MLIKQLDQTNINYTNLVTKINFKSQIQPKASIIICVHNRLNYTLNCLYRLSKIPDKTPFEIIIINDCSNDLTNQILSKINGLKYFNNSRNLGFLHSANRGADEANGKYIVFLNNDTIVSDYWLDNLVDYLEKNNDVGLVGSKLIYPDYILQEAGGIVFVDGNAMNFGKGDDPDRPIYNYCRDVDYCSGASIAISKELFMNLGKFSETYAPCYYEDTDLAFKVRQFGLRVCYVHLSQVVHFEGISCGKDTENGPKKNQIINKTKFQQRWSTILAKNIEIQTLPINKWLIPHIDKKRILVIDQCLTPDKDSGSFRMWNILKILSSRYHVSFWPYFNPPDQKYNRQLTLLGIELLENSLFKTILFLQANGRYFDYVIICRPYILDNRLKIIKTLCHKAKIIYDTVDLHYLRLSRQAEFVNDKKEKKQLLRLSRKFHAIEFSGIINTDQTWVVTETEKTTIHSQNVSARVHVVPNIHPYPEIATKSYDNTKDILFIGSMSHPPNLDAMLFFIKNIWPSTASNIPEAKLIIIGHDPANTLHEFQSSNIIIKGYVPDIEEDLMQARIFVAPLRYGAGMKGKIGQALSYGIPTVTTSIGAEGFGFKGDELIIEDDPVRFFNHIVSIYNDKTIWDRYHKSGRAFIKQLSPAEVGKRIWQALDDLQ